MSKQENKSAADLYAGTNKRLTIIVVLMSIWTIMLIIGSILVALSAYVGIKELYHQGRELKSTVVDKSSALYNEVLNDLKTELSGELKTAITEGLESGSKSTDSGTYDKLIKSLNQ